MSAPPGFSPYQSSLNRFDTPPALSLLTEPLRQKVPLRTPRAPTPHKAVSVPEWFQCPFWFQSPAEFPEWFQHSSCFRFTEPLRTPRASTPYKAVSVSEWHQCPSWLQSPSECPASLQLLSSFQPIAFHCTLCVAVPLREEVPQRTPGAPTPHKSVSVPK